MPVISFPKSELDRLLGREVSEDYLEKALEDTKVNLEAFSEEEVEFEVPADRMDLVTIEGIVRMLKGVLEVELGIPRFRVIRKSLETHVGESVKDVRPYVVVGLVKNVDLSTEESLISLIEAQEKLHATIGRGRRRVAIGLHDFSKVTPPIKYDARPAKEVVFRPLGEPFEMTAEEVLEQLEKGKEYRHIIENPKGLVPLILDSKDNVLSMPPIINSELTRLTPGIRDVLIDVTGTDLKAITQAMDILAYSLAERGGEIHTSLVIYPDGLTVESPTPEPREMSASLDFIKSIVGLDLTASDVKKALQRARLDAEVGEEVKVKIPPYRYDFLHPVDLAEEVAITYGLNKMGYELPENVMTIGKRHPVERLSSKYRVLMIGLGYQEVLNYIMTSKEVLFWSVGRPERPVVEVANPVSESYAVLRDSLLPGLLHFLAKNTHVPYPHKVFELGDVVLMDERAETRTRDERRLAATYSDISVGFEDIYSHLKFLFDSLGIKVSLDDYHEPPFLKGRCAKILVNGEAVGVIGEIDPEVLLRLGINNPVAAFEVRVI